MKHISSHCIIHDTSEKRLKHYTVFFSLIYSSHIHIIPNRSFFLKLYLFLFSDLSTEVQVVIHKSIGKFKKVWEKLYHGTAGFYNKL